MPTLLTLQGTLGYTNPTQSDAYGNNSDTLLPVSLAMALGIGTGAGQADHAFRDHRTLATAAYSYTLSALAGSQVIVKPRLAYIKVLSAPGSGGSLVVAPDATHGWAGIGGSHTLVPGSQLLITWPDTTVAPVVASTNDVLTLTATGTIEYLIVLCGTSA